jgi:hypothetical protein
VCPIQGIRAEPHASAGQGLSRTGEEGRDCGWSSLTPEEVPIEGDDRVTVCRRLVLPPTQELHLVSVVLPQVRNAEDPGGLGVLDHHHVALRVVGLDGHAQVVARLVFVSYLKCRLHGGLLLASPIPPQLQRVVGVEATGARLPGRRIRRKAHTLEGGPHIADALLVCEYDGHP